MTSQCRNPIASDRHSLAIDGQTYFSFDVGAEKNKAVLGNIIFLRPHIKRKTSGLAIDNGEYVTGIGNGAVPPKLRRYASRSMSSADLRAIFGSVKLGQPLFSLHFNKVQHCTVLNLHKFSYSYWPIFFISERKEQGKSIFVAGADG